MHQPVLLCLLLSVALSVAVVLPVYKGCGAVITGVSDGIIDYPGNGRNYPNNQTCCWEIFVSEGDRMKVSFQRFKTSNKKDSLIIKHAQGGKKIGTFYGKKSPKIIETKYNILYLNFSSDARNNHKGFRLTWKKIAGNASVEPPVEFIIKHKISGQYLRTDDNYYLRFSTYNKTNHGMVFTFESILGEWGYIHNVKSGLLLTNPHYMNPKEDDSARPLLRAERRPWALFALDQINNYIIYFNDNWFIGPTSRNDDGYLNPYNTYYPPDNWRASLRYAPNITKVVLEFIFVNPNNTDEEVFPYGSPHITGDWNLVYCVENPKATHTHTEEVNIGKSNHLSTTNTKFKYPFEAGVSIKVKWFSASADPKLTGQIEQSSSQTWSSQTTVTDSITVNAGQTVAVWQKHFIGEQLGHRGVHLSNLFADTNSCEISPDANRAIQYRFL